jgi:ABC-2 type transport system ATP-binding protein
MTIKVVLPATARSAGASSIPPVRCGGWQVISQRSTAGRATALVRCDDAARITGPGLQDAAPTFDELVLGYLDGAAAALPEEALA